MTTHPEYTVPTAWSQATSTDHMSRLVIDWLRGRALGLPWNQAPPDDETHLIRDELIAINQRPGVVTTCSQPGLELPTWRQRAFLEGVATRPALNAIANQLNSENFVISTRVALTADAPVISERLPGCLPNTFARAGDLDELFLHEPLHSHLASIAKPFCIHDRRWNCNEMWDLLPSSARPL